MFSGEGSIATSTKERHSGKFPFPRGDDHDVRSVPDFTSSTMVRPLISLSLTEAMVPDLGKGEQKPS